MSTCQTPACDEQHGLVDGVCSDCDLVVRVLLNDRVLLRVQEAAEVLQRHGLLGCRTTFQNSTRDFGVPVRTHRVEPNTAEQAAFWDDPCWTRKAQRRSAEAPVAAESVQPACPTCHGHGFVVRFSWPDERRVRGDTYVPCPERTCPSQRLNFGFAR